MTVSGGGDRESLWSVSYMHNGAQYCVQLHGTWYEVESHAQRLGLTVDGEVVVNGLIPDGSILERIFRAGAGSGGDA